MPAYNEEARLQKMLFEHTQFLQEYMQKDSSLQSVEFVIVDDGSKDSTWEIIKEWTKKFGKGRDLSGDLLPEEKIIIRGL